MAASPRPRGFLESYEAQASADAREAELVAAERKLIRSLGEAGYRSPWQTSLKPDGPPGFRDWRKARNDYAATGRKADLEDMLWHVTHENPPLASDTAEPEAARAGLTVRGLLATPVPAWLALLAWTLLLAFSALFLGLLT